MVLILLTDVSPLAAPSFYSKPVLDSRHQLEFKHQVSLFREATAGQLNVTCVHTPSQDFTQPSFM